MHSFVKRFLMVFCYANKTWQIVLIRKLGYDIIVMQIKLVKLIWRCFNGQGRNFKKSTK